ncbi:hypothetical protein Y695_04584 [Hydrogenophaga sp. T4]|nr:hypothetical protein Y695_04584 [Hydrogenophaga sp. T4]
MHRLRGLHRLCDEVMDKMGYAPGLIRYSSGNGIEQGWTPAHMLRRICDRGC